MAGFECTVCPDTVTNLIFRLLWTLVPAAGSAAWQTERNIPLQKELILETSQILKPK